MLKFLGAEKRLVGIMGIPARDITLEELEARKEEWAEVLGCQPDEVGRILVRGGAYALSQSDGTGWVPKKIEPKAEEPCTPCEKKRKKREVISDGTV